MVFMMVLMNIAMERHGSMMDSMRGKCSKCGMSDKIETGHDEMRGMLGNYPMKREASGTSWQPDSTPMEGVPGTLGKTVYMYQGFANYLYDEQGGPRGDKKSFSTNMITFMAHHPVRKGTLGFRSRLSLEPLTIGKEGYPELFQTGETSDGKTRLIDRQHSHDLFMEMALVYSLPLATESSLFLYGALPGEPALGPTAYVHRFSGMYIPDAPLTHQWLDSTHVTFGVLTAGYIWKNMKLEGSAFRSNEPEEYRWDMGSSRFDSYSARFSVNPSPEWALQASCGMLKGPKQQKPEENTGRTTISATHNKAFQQNNWQTMFAWGRNTTESNNLDGFLLESTLNLNTNHFIFARGESVQKNEFFVQADPLANEIFLVGKIELGYEYYFRVMENLQWGMGASGAIHFVPEKLKSIYNDMPTSYFLFTGIRLR